MTEGFLAGPLADLETLMERLRAALDGLHAQEPALLSAEAALQDLARAADQARDLLGEAQLFEELERFESDLAREDRFDALVVRIMEIMNPLKTAMIQATAHALEATEALVSVAEEADSSVRKRMDAVEVVRGRARTVIARRKAVVNRPPEGFEETLPFEPLVEVLSSDPAERRRHPRGNLSIEIRLQNPHRLLAGSSENVSVGGVFVATNEAFELGSLVSLTLRLPNGLTVRADGVVSWIRERSSGTFPGIGVEFLALADTDREVLEMLALKEHA
ncbi:MAG: hypothetical protein FJ109_15865 [Deltaproteobacteria bacterium]|nr:hypothetical protein [Deltaproteobacteria bacterium]